MSMDVIEEELEDTKGVIRIRKSKNSQKKIESTNNDSQNHCTSN
jgi:hypothetical protein